MGDGIPLNGDGAGRPRRLYLFRDFSNGTAASLPALFEQHDEHSRYGSVREMAEAQAHPGSTVVCFVENNQEQIDAFSAELRSYATQAAKVSVVVITDIDDPATQRIILRGGVRQLLSSKLPISIAAEILSAIRLAAVLAPASLILAEVLSPLLVSS